MAIDSICKKEGQSFLFFFFKHVASAILSMLQLVVMLPRMYEQHKFDLIGLKQMRTQTWVNRKGGSRGIGQGRMNKIKICYMEFSENY